MTIYLAAFGFPKSIIAFDNCKLLFRELAKKGIIREPEVYRAYIDVYRKRVSFLKIDDFRLSRYIWEWFSKTNEEMRDCYVEAIRAEVTNPKSINRQFPRIMRNLGEERWGPLELRVYELM